MDGGWGGAAPLRLTFSKRRPPKLWANFGGTLSFVFFLSLEYLLLCMVQTSYQGGLRLSAGVFHYQLQSSCHYDFNKVNKREINVLLMGRLLTQLRFLKTCQLRL